MVALGIGHGDVGGSGGCGEYRRSEDADELGLGSYAWIWLQNEDWKTEMYVHILRKCPKRVKVKGGNSKDQQFQQYSP